MSRRVRLVLVAVACVVVASALAWLVEVRKYSGEWAFRPPAAPEKVHVFDRTYLRGTSTLPPDPAATPVGETFGGGTIVSIPPAPYVPTVLWVIDGEDSVVYELSGGP